MEITRKFTAVLLEKLQRRETLDYIQIVLGPRQVGKTTGVKQLLENWRGKTLYHSADGVLDRSPDWLVEKWQELRNAGEHALLVIDEIHKIHNWSNVAKLLFDQDRHKRKIKVVFLGSASLNIQQGLGESLAGRFNITEVYHWNFLEHQQLNNWALEQYLKFGGYPGISHDIDSGDWMNLMQNSIIEPILTRDIFNFQNIGKPALFKQTFSLAVAYTGCEISLTKLLGQLQDKGNITTIKSYLEILESAFILKLIYKYSKKELVIRNSIPKIIVRAPGLVTGIRNNIELGRIIESAVGSHLLSLDFKLYYFRDGYCEVDYIIEADNLLIGIEVKSGNKQISTLNKNIRKYFPDIKMIYINSSNLEDFFKISDQETMLKFIKNLI